MATAQPVAHVCVACTVIVIQTRLFVPAVLLLFMQAA